MMARTTGPLDEAAQQLSSAGGSAAALTGDVTSQTDVDRIAGAVRAQFGQIDFLCNCAGQSTRKAVLDTTIEDFQQLWETNFLAAVRMTRAFADDLIDRHGHLVNIGSLASKVAPRFYGGYPASKFALAAYSQQLRLELGPRGLHVLLVCPGPLKRLEQSPRYDTADPNIPVSAQEPGGGARLKGIDPDQLAKWILTACEHRQEELIVPAKARILMALSAISPRWGDWLLKKSTGG